jgi:hypothetical protein
VTIPATTPHDQVDNAPATTTARHQRGALRTRHRLSLLHLHRADGLHARQSRPHHPQTLRPCRVHRSDRQRRRLLPRRGHRVRLRHPTPRQHHRPSSPGAQAWQRSPAHRRRTPSTPPSTPPSSAPPARPGDHRGRLAYVTTDGGTTTPPDGVVRKATVLRLDIHPTPYAILPFSRSRPITRVRASSPKLAVCNQAFARLG